MTAPAVVRRWEQGPPGPVGRPANEGGAPVERRRGERGEPIGRRRGVESTRGAVRDQLAGLRHAAPLAAALLTALAAHAGLAAHLAVGGWEPDVLLVAVAAVAAGRGARAGAAVGFVAGLGADLFLATPLGTSAVAYTLVGHVVGRSSPPRAPASAAALCTPTSTCFACRTGRRHAAGPGDAPSPGRGEASRPTRQGRRTMIRRAALRRSVTLAFLAVAGGRAGTAVVATALGGIPFPTTASLLHIVGVAVVSAPLGIPAVAAGRRFGRDMGSRR